RGAGIEGDAERVAEAPGEGLLAADLSGSRRAAGDRARLGVRPSEGVRRRDPLRGGASRRRGAQDLAEEDRLVSGGVVGPAAAAPAAAAVARVVAAAVPDAHVEEPVGPELEIAAVVVAGPRRYLVHEDLLARGVHHVRVGQDEARDAVDDARAEGRAAGALG